jgi:hypothetical protein
MPVHSKHVCYEESDLTWQRIRDCIAGQDAIKSEGKLYLPDPDEGGTNTGRYNTYLQRAVFYNATARTQAGLLGSIFRKPVEIDLPQEIDYMLESADGAGKSLDQMAKDVTNDVIAVGRAFLLAEFPECEPIKSAQEQADNSLVATLAYYPAESVINWRQERTVCGMRVVMVVLEEPHVECEDYFVETVEKQWRVLRIGEDGYYYQDLYRQQSESSDQSDAEIVMTVRPLDAAGNPMLEIPGVFIGAVDNDADVDKAPLADISALNIAHYRNSADYEEMLFVSGQPTVALNGLDDAWIGAHLSGGIRIGARGSLLLPEGSDAKMMQVNANDAISDAMAHKEQQMISLGARIVSEKAGVEAADTLRMRQNGEASLLSTIVANVSEGFQKALGYAYQFMSTSQSQGVVFELNTDIVYDKLSQQEVDAVVSLWKDGVIALSDVRSQLRDGEILDRDRTDEEIDAEVQEEEGRSSGFAAATLALQQLELERERDAVSDEQNGNAI